MRSRCFKKEFDLQLALMPWFLYYLTRRWFFHLGKKGELVSRFKKRLGMFPGCLHKIHEGVMSINMLLCKVQKHDIIV